MILLQKVKLLNPAAMVEQIVDVLLCDGVIQTIKPNITDFSSDVTIIEAESLILGPGLVDLYSHSGEPGKEERETWSSLADAAMAGGFTRLSILPDVIPAVDNIAVLNSLLQKTAPLSPHCQFWGALTINHQGQQMSEIAELAPQVVGFSDGYPLNDWNLLRRLLEYIKPTGKPVALWPVNTKLRGNGVMREGMASICFGLPGDPSISEASAIASILELVATIETPVHLMRISTERGVELIADAKAKGLPITASTTWMHLLFDTDAIKTYDPNLRLEPPLGNPSDLKALIEAVKTGTIDAIAVDHSPYTYEEKTLAFAEAPPGVIGLELVLPILWERFVVKENWSMLELWRALSTNPALCLGQKPPTCVPGEPAELVLFDPQQTWTVNRQNLKSLSVNSPWLGKQVTGRVVQVYKA